ncbi:similar to Saccharomyces cerevisiae YOR141C ARP8 Nuclear actin-related protein involved in chromatin remodeling, component of chromatin-remodeling enzyme complexes [Maudiozyma saulgeensis]|uniref:Similar to Saccharomyces cerevisiae YOR141C ARP8 Nuclear actin-related protein involved in chromatin remodeling, component of chromatin-remodeling enzyme complexes n=1 Tax=Maudiozyma saulgeensis TaxID=1789683 RepID=A0A1X7QYT2_9SACH|nr:similar to Saccharomyces cerevisiae YOR141C ARP8 Nuclear actin-related protein involved in chromatin remodeling, component of chromatin-remodeling enzyme complexes [Kazachstania saulgeensis]
MSNQPEDEDTHPVSEQEMDTLRSSTTTPSIHQDKKPKINNNNNKTSVGNSQPKKVPLHLLEKRRLGRIKAAEEFAKKLKQAGIEKFDNENIATTGRYQAIQLINQKNYSSDYLKKDDQTFALRERKHLRNKITSNNNNEDNNNNQWTEQDFEDLAATTFNNKCIKYNHEKIDLNDPSNTIVIQLGHTSMKIGFALDETPIVIPNCIAIPNTSSSEEEEQNSKWFETNSSEFMNLKSLLYQSFKERMRYYKRRIQPNSHEQVKSFNTQVTPEVVSLQKDPAHIPWITDTKENNDYLYGDEAILASEPWFNHRKPFTSGGAFNIQSGDYSSLQELLGDVTNLLNYALTKLFKRYREDQKKKQQEQEQEQPEDDNTTIKDMDFESSRFKAILVIPDLFQKSHIEAMIRLLITELPFQAVAIIQESLANCYGAGLGTSTCVVNIGASSTNVACVDEGSVVENSIIKLNYGGDDITKLFSVLLKQNNFPYHNWDPSSLPGWHLAETLKKNLVTFQDDGVAVQLTNFLKRMPNEPIEKYEFKIFDEVMLAPLALFYPEIFKLLKEQNKDSKKFQKIIKNLKLQLPDSQDFFTDDSNDLKSISQEETLHDSNLKDDETPDSYTDIHDENLLLRKLLDVNDKLDEISTTAIDDSMLNMIPLDKAIIQSITNASLTMDPSRMHTYYSNILVVGGTSNIEAFDFMLTDRINIWRPRLLSLSTFPAFYEGLVKKIKEQEKKFNSEKSKPPSNITTENDNDNENTDDNKDSNNDNGVIENNSENGEDTKSSLKSDIDNLINTELQKFVGTLDKSANNNDHYSPVTVIPPPREMDPASLCWKGGSVLAQVKLIEELYITYGDWDMHGSRILQYKCIFPY